MEKLPRALQLADWLDEVNAVPHPIHTKSAAAELRRLHEVNAELVERLKNIAECCDNVSSESKVHIDAKQLARLVIKDCDAAIAKATGEQL